MFFLPSEVFFIVLLLSFGCWASADDSDDIGGRFDERDYQEPVRRRVANDDLAVLVAGVVVVGKIRASGSAKTRAASEKPTPCFFRFAPALRSFHSNVGMYAYACGEGDHSSNRFLRQTGVFGQDLLDALACGQLLEDELNSDLRAGDGRFTHHGLGSDVIKSWGIAARFTLSLQRDTRGARGRPPFSQFRRGGAVAFQAQRADVFQVALAAAFHHRDDVVGIPEAFSQTLLESPFEH